MDLDQVITRDNRQLQTVGHHWPLDGPLPREVRANMERVGVCLSCHKEIPQGRFIYRFIATVGEKLGLVPATDAEHQKLIGRAMFVAANTEVFGPVLLGLVAVIFFLAFRRRRRWRPRRRWRQ